MSIEESEIAVRQSNVYASAYAIISPSSTANEVTYVTDNGETTYWPNQALFDTARDAIAVALEFGITLANVVKLDLVCYAKKLLALEDIETEEPIPTPQTPIRVA